MAQSQAGISFHLKRDGLQIRHPDGRPFPEAWESIQRIEEERARSERLAAKLRSLGIDPEK